MKLLLSIENERELGASLANANLPGVTDDDLEAAGGEMTTAACHALHDRGIDYEMVYHQSVGAFVIVQSADDDEREVWDSAIDAARPAAEKLLATRSAQASA